MITRLIKVYYQSIALLLSVVFLLVGCATKGDYHDARSIPAITVPENLDKSTLGHLYGIPAELTAKYANDETETKTPLPPGLSSRPIVTKASVQALGDQFWITVPTPPAAVWSQLLRVLQELKQPIIKQDLASATVATGWSTMGAQAQVTHRYQIQLQAGLQPEVTEVHLVNKKANADAIFNNIELASQTTQWPAQSDNKVHERWFLDELTKALNTSASQGDSLLASRIALPEKVAAVNVVGEPVIALSLSRQRAYAALNQSLSQAAISLYEQNAEKGVFYIDSVSEQGQQKTKKSFLQKLISGGNTATTASGRYPLKQILLNLPDEAVVNSLFPDERTTSTLSGVVGYLLVLRPSDDKHYVYIRDGYGRTLPTDTARELLDIVQQELL